MNYELPMPEVIGLKPNFSVNQLWSMESIIHYGAKYRNKFNSNNDRLLTPDFKQIMTISQRLALRDRNGDIAPRINIVSRKLTHPKNFDFY